MRIHSSKAAWRGFVRRLCGATCVSLLCCAGCHSGSGGGPEVLPMRLPGGAGAAQKPPADVKPSAANPGSVRAAQPNRSSR